MRVLIALITLFLTLSSAATGQNIVRESDGLFYNENNRLYTGTYREYHENGNVKLEIPVRRGLKNGQVILYFGDGSKNEIRSYRSGEMHGTWITWGKSGNRIAQAVYRRGLKDGNWYIWDDAGQLRYDMNYKRGDRTGTWKMFDEAGNLVMAQSY